MLIQYIKISCLFQLGLNSKIKILPCSNPHGQATYRLYIFKVVYTNIINSSVPYLFVVPCTCAERVNSTIQYFMATFITLPNT